MRSRHEQKLALSIISPVLILNTIHRHFQKGLHGMTSINPPPRGNDRIAEERADGRMAAIRMHRESLLSWGRLMQVTTSAMHSAQPAHLAELWAGRGSKMVGSLVELPPLESPSSTHQPLALSGSPGFICCSLRGNPKGLAALTGRSRSHLSSNCFFLSSCCGD